MIEKAVTTPMVTAFTSDILAVELDFVADWGEQQGPRRSTHLPATASSARHFSQQ